MQATLNVVFRSPGRIGMCAIIVMTCLITIEAQAQRGGGPRLAPEKLDAAWSAEASGVARENGVSADNTAKLVAAYKVSREAQGKEMQEMMATAQRGPGMFQEMMEISESQAATLRKNVSAFLSDKEIEGVMTSLGSYNRSWDRFVDTLLGFELKEEDNFKALALIANYVMESDKARAEAIAAMDFESMRVASQELKGMLDLAIGGLLSDEQIIVWNEATQQRRRGGGGGQRN